ncbi:Frataxin [Coprinopsis sp. MPI-PUGE-AT-0042]|nr:Frataxin [Coprinopsis sp. MPI-PUGE-AT-0042]
MRSNTLRSISRGLRSSAQAASRPSLAAPLLRRAAWATATTQPSACPLASRHVRWYATPAPMVNESHLSVEEYHNLSDTTMDSLLESLEELLDGIANPSFEVEYHSGVLTLSMGEHGTYVINKQPPNKQIWLSSPVSGPKRYDYSEELDDWIYSRDGRPMGELLNTELSQALGREVNLNLNHISEKA